MDLEYIRDKSKEMPIIESPEDVISIRVWHCKYHSLREIGKCINLRVLVIATLPESDFQFLSACKKLKYLSILHMPKIQNLEGLSHLLELETLSLRSLPSWDAAGKVTIVSSLVPLAKLPDLKHVELFGVVEQGKSPLVLEKCNKLRSARFSKYDKKYVEQFYASTGVEYCFAPEPEYVA